jgi:hypothetical protein
MTKGWSTKYALTNGIQQIEVEIKEDSDCCFHYPNGENKLSACLFINKDFFENHNDALEAAEKMRSKKIASLKKQIKKLQVINWDSK